MLLDGKPTDEYGKPSDQWKAERDSLVNRPKGQVKPATIVAVGCGPDVEATLKAISTGTTFHIGTGEASFVAPFRFISQSIADEASLVEFTGN